MEHCLTKVQIAACYLGKLSAPTFETAARHLQQCPHCQAVAETVGDISDDLIAELKEPAGQYEFESEPELQHALSAIRAMRFAPISPVPPTAEGEDSPNDSSIFDLPLGTIRDYEILEGIGRGGMGTVYKARHTRLKRIVALKVLLESRVSSAAALRRFEREMEAVGLLKHPNIVHAYDAGEEGGQHYLVMEYVDGADLSRLCKAHGPLAVANACEILRQAALGLQHAHEHGLVHRDVKPSNLLLTREGQVKVLDLGMALLRDVEATPDDTRAAGTAAMRDPAAKDRLCKHTAAMADPTSTQIVGTCDYMAPEQTRGAHEVDIRADVYSLGCTLYKLLTGHAPFEALDYGTPAEKMMAHAQVAAPPLRERRMDVPEKLAAIVHRMLAKEPGARFATPAEVAEAMKPFAVGSDLGNLLSESSCHPVDTSSIGTSPPQRSRWVILAAGGAAAAVLFGIVFLISAATGAVRLEFSDAAAARQCTVSIDGDDIRVENLGEPIKLRPGKHRLRVLRGDLEIETREFDVLWHGDHVVRVQIAASPAEAPGDFDEAELIRRRAYDLGCRGEYSRAVSEYTKAIQRYPDEVQWWLQRAVAELADGQNDLYRRHCAEMLRRFGQRRNLGHHPSADLCWACYMAPGGIADPSAALGLADRAIAAIPDREIYMVRRGAVLYRIGRIDEAIAQLNRVHDLLQAKKEPHLIHEDVTTCSFLAMAHRQLGRRDEAKHWLAKAREQMERTRRQERIDNVCVYWNNGLPTRLILDEAIAALGADAAEKPAISKDRSPATGIEPKKTAGKP